jgi:uncharacterized membrane protein
LACAASATSTLTNPEANIRLGMLYFSQLVRRFGGIYYALASYNAGENRVVRWKAERPGLDEDEFIDDIPFPETQNYVKRILGTAEDYRPALRPRRRTSAIGVRAPALTARLLKNAALLPSALRLGSFIDLPSARPAVQSSRLPVSLCLIRQYRWPAGALALFTALTVVHLWPMAAAPGVWSPQRRALTTSCTNGSWRGWRIRSSSDPLHLFDANIFYPDRYTLAYSDHLILQSLMGAPLTWIGASPVLVHNLVLIAGFVLTAWTTALVVAAWTGNRTAGVLSGSLLAFNSFTLTRLAQMQDLHLEFFAPALFALDRFHRDRPDEGRVEARRLVRAAGAHRHLRDALHRHLAGRGRRRARRRVPGPPFRSIASRALLAAARRHLSS